MSEEGPDDVDWTSRPTQGGLAAACPWDENVRDVLDNKRKSKEKKSRTKNKVTEGEAES